MKRSILCILLLLLSCNLALADNTEFNGDTIKGVLSFSLVSDWGRGYAGTMTIHNTGNEEITNWTIEFDWQENINRIYDAKIINHSGDSYTITNAGWNANIAPGASQSFTVLGQPGHIDSSIQNLRINGESSYTEDDPSTDEPDNDVPVDDDPSVEPSASAPPSAGMLFDDFNYDGPNSSDFTGFGWYASSYSGGVGPAGSAYDPANVTFVANSSISGDKLLRLICSTSGTPASTKKAEVCHKQQYREGTWAARIKFNNAPVTGPDVDEMVQTFFGYYAGANHNEIDFEYMPNGGWGQHDSTMWVSSYDVNGSNAGDGHTYVNKDCSGWKIYSITVKDNAVTFYNDGELIGTLNNYPPDNMYILFNHWITAEGLDGNTAFRSWEQDVDWVYYAKDNAYNMEEIAAHVQWYRNNSVKRVDTVQ